jgi:hypothetical protein
MTSKEKAHLAIGTVVLLFLAVIVFMPELPIGRDRRTILHFISAMLICLLFGSTAADKVTWKGNGAFVVLSGSAAIALVTFAALQYFSRGEEVVAVFDIVDTSGKPLPLQPVESVVVQSESSATNPAFALNSSTLFVVFRDDVGAIRISIQPTASEAIFHGRAELPAHARRTLRLGKDLVPMK